MLESEPPSSYNEQIINQYLSQSLRFYLLQDSNYYQDQSTNTSRMIQHIVEENKGAILQLTNVGIVLKGLMNNQLLNSKIEKQNIQRIKRVLQGEKMQVQQYQKQLGIVQSQQITNLQQLDEVKKRISQCQKDIMTIKQRASKINKQITKLIEKEERISLSQFLKNLKLMKQRDMSLQKKYTSLRLKIGRLKSIANAFGNTQVKEEQPQEKVVQCTLKKNVSDKFRTSKKVKLNFKRLKSSGNPIEKKQESQDPQMAEEKIKQSKLKRSFYQKQEEVELSKIQVREQQISNSQKKNYVKFFDIKKQNGAQKFKEKFEKGNEVNLIFKNIVIDQI